jgi:hypothetical protein
MVSVNPINDYFTGANASSASASKSRIRLAARAFGQESMIVNFFCIAHPYTYTIGVAARHVNNHQFVAACSARDKSRSVSEGVRAVEAVASLQRRSVEQGTDRFTMDEIEAGIQSVRK